MQRLSEYIKSNWTLLMIAVLLSFSIVYAWNLNYMTALEYRIASEKSIKESLLEAQKKLRIELAMLKSPERIASIAMKQLQMTYAKREQVVFVKRPGRATSKPD